MSQSTYTVTGMTCQHCVDSVTREVGAVDGVTDVAVDLPNGAVTITSGAPVNDGAVRAAIEEAGFEVAS